MKKMFSPAGSNTVSVFPILFYLRNANRQSWALMQVKLSGRPASIPAEPDQKNLTSGKGAL